jgi:hypothetical protein
LTTINLWEQPWSFDIGPGISHDNISRSATAREKPSRRLFNMMRSVLFPSVEEVYRNSERIWRGMHCKEALLPMTGIAPLGVLFGHCVQRMQKSVEI